MTDQPVQEATSNRFVGALLGMVVGDAIAKPSIGWTPYSTHKKYQWLDAYYQIDGAKGGEYSHISRMSLEVAKSIVEKGCIEEKACADVLVGKVSTCHDLDVVSKESLSRYAAGIQLDKAGDPNSQSHEFLARLIPVGIYAAAKGHDGIELAKLCRSVCGVTHSSRGAILAGWVVAKLVRDSIRNFKILTNPYEWYQSDKSLLAQMIDFARKAESTMKIDKDTSLAERLLFSRRRLQDGTSIPEFVGLIGNRQGAGEVLPFSVFCFMKNPDSFKAVIETATMGGASTTNAALVGAMVGAYAGFSFIPEDIRNDTSNSSNVVLLGEKLAEVLLKC